MDKEPKDHPKLNKLLNRLTYPLYIISQLIIWGFIIHFTLYYNLSLTQVMYYLLCSDIFTIGFITFAILPNILITKDLIDKNENKTNVNNVV